MNKKIFFFLFLTNINTLFSQENKWPQFNPDVSIQTVFDADAQNFMLNIINKVVTDITGVNPLHYSFKEPIVIDGPMKGNMQELIYGVVSSIFNYPFDEGRLHIQIDGLNYHINKSEVLIKETQGSKDKRKLNLTFKLYETVIETKKTSIDIKGVEGKESFIDDVVIYLEGLGMSSPHLNSLTLNSDIMVERIDGKLLFTILDAKADYFQDITLEEIKKDVKVKVDESSLSHDLSLSLGTTRIDSNDDSLIYAIEKRNDRIADMLLKPIVKLFHSLPQKMGDSLDKYRSFSIADNINFKIMGEKTSLEIADLNFIRDGQLFLDTFIGQKESVSFSEVEDFEFSFEDIHQKIQDEEADIIVSASEKGLSKMIQKFLSQRFPENQLSKEIRIGSQGIRWVQRENDQGEIVVDLFIRPTFFKRLGLFLLTGKSEITLPVVIRPEIFMTFEENKNYLNLKWHHDYTDFTSLSQSFYGVENDLAKIKRSKKLIHKFLLKKLNEILNKLEKKVYLPIFDNLNMKVLEIKSNQHGRLNFLFKLSYCDQEELLKGCKDSHPYAQEFWEQLPAFISEQFAKKEERRKN